MPVVATCMHDAFVLGFVIQIFDFLDWQRIHIGAQPNDLAARRLTAPDDSNHTGSADPFDNFVDPEFFKFLCNYTSCPVDVEHQLWMGVQVAAPFYDFRMELGKSIDDWQCGPPRIND